jgi:hypothetical protein
MGAPSPFGKFLVGGVPSVRLLPFDSDSISLLLTVAHLQLFNSFSDRRSLLYNPLRELSRCSSFHILSCENASFNVGAALLRGDFSAPIGAIQSATGFTHIFTVGARRLQGFGGGTPSSRFQQHTVDAWPLQSHFELHLIQIRVLTEERRI